MSLSYAADNHAARGRSAQCAGLVVQAASQTAHAVLAARGEWITNDKTLLSRAGLEPLNHLIPQFRPDPAALREAVETARSLCTEAVRAAVGSA